MASRAFLVTPFRLATYTLLVVIVLAADARQAHAIPACTAAQVYANDPSCPSGAGACTITRVFDVANNCVLDFGARDVTMAASGEINMAQNTVTIRARSFTVAAGSLIDGRGLAATPRGGILHLETTGNVSVVRSGSAFGRIDMSGNAAGGELRITAGGSITNSGRLEADALTATAKGGTIALDAGGNITSNVNGAISAQGGSGGSGEVSLIAGGNVTVSDLIDLRGNEGGFLDVAADGEVALSQVEARATIAEGSGGNVDVVAGTQVRILGAISLDGFSGTLAGGYGGAITLDALGGDVSVAANVSVNGASPDGGGGDITFTAAGSVIIGATTMTTSRGAGLGDGGIVEFDAGLDVLLHGQVDATGGYGGGEITALALRHITVNGFQEAAGTNAGGFGGNILMEAGIIAGSLTINNLVNVSGGGCNELGGCGVGGSTDLSGCNVTVTTSGRVDARGGDGGENYLQAREQLAISNTVLATPIVTTGFNGTNFLVYPSRKPATGVAQVQPAPTVVSSPTCTAPGVPAGCLTPCPTCGNGVIEYPETCDQAGTPQNCDGCSRFCEIESCNGSNPCVTTSCDLLVGCQTTPVPNGTSCSDSSVCNGNETCQNGLCAAGTTLNCSDGNPCTLDTCNPLTGCVVPRPPAPTGTACNDNNQCTTADTCVLGTCTGTTVSCNDSRECTTDSCVPASGCVNTPRTGTCTDDGNACTTDVCNAGDCTHPARPNGTTCEDGAYCTVNDICVGGLCTAGPARSCADPNPCTDDSCNEALDTCVNAASAPGAPCNDNNQCTTADSCQAGTCTGQTVNCDDGRECTNDSCNPASGCANPPRTGPCTDDGNTCTTDVCNAGNCTHPGRPDGTACEDGAFCTSNDTCTGGSCTPGPANSCADPNPCTDDSCNEALDACVNNPSAPGSPCNDNNQCTTADSCQAGTCTGQTLNCDDGRECTNDSCNPTSGCTNPPRSGSCTDDGNTCTTDVCNAGECTHPGQPDGTPCEDGAFCTLDDTCIGGSCTPGPPNPCADTDACTQDSCDETLDMCVNTASGNCCGDGLPDGDEECDDGNQNNDDGCLNTCELASCGDGLVRTGVEECDLGSGNSDAPDAACRTDCRNSRCGDGITDAGRDEQCDDGNTTGGDTCSPQCWISPPATAGLISGGRSPRDCALEVAINNPVLDRRGAPSFRQSCRNGTACDNGSQPGECVFHIWLCVNNQDARLTRCTPGPAGIGTVAGIQVGGPSANDAAKRPEDAANRSELQKGAQATAGRGLDFCGPRLSIRVPLRDPTKAGRKNVRLRGVVGANRTDNDNLQLTCQP